MAMLEGDESLTLDALNLATQAWVEQEYHRSRHSEIGVTPLAHYLASGMAEGRATYAAIGLAVNGFDAEYYLMHNPDVAASGTNPLDHYDQFGWKEGRDPSVHFDTLGYLAANPDVAAAHHDGAIPSGATVNVVYTYSETVTAVAGRSSSPTAPTN